MACKGVVKIHFLARSGVKKSLFTLASQCEMTSLVSMWILKFPINQNIGFFMLNNAIQIFAVSVNNNKILKIVFACTIISALNSCGSHSRFIPAPNNYNHSQLKVVNGQNMSITELKSMGLVALAVDPNRADRRGICTGTLVGRRALLTAKHCLKNPLGALTFAVFGTDTFSGESTRIAIDKTIPLVIPGSPDLAFVTLKTDAPTEYVIQKLKLSFAPQGQRVLKKVFGAGFGRLNTSAPFTGGIARFANTRINPIEPAMPILLANSGQGFGFCFGDSGGPLFADEGAGLFVVGVLSSGATTCETGLDSYVSVAFYGKALSEELLKVIEK